MMCLGPTTIPSKSFQVIALTEEVAVSRVGFVLGNSWNLIENESEGERPNRSVGKFLKFILGVFPHVLINWNLILFV